MEENMTPTSEHLYASLSGRKLPRWEALPDLELYMDQVLSLVERFLSADPGAEGKGLTASMVNNYVKLGVMPPPVKKRYTREHLAYLIMICVLKVSLPMGAIRSLLQRETGAAPVGEVYDRFCAMYESAGRDTASAYADAGEAADRLILRSALRAASE